MERKISFINEENYKYVVYELESGTKCESLAMKMMEYNEIPQLLQAFEDEGGELKWEYDVTDCLLFQETLPEQVSRNDAFPLFQKMLFILKALRTNFISEPDILLDMNYIYIDKNTSMIKFIATPDIQPEENSVVNLMKNMLERLSWKEEEKKTYLDVYTAALEEEDVTYDRLIEVIKEIMATPLEMVEVVPEPPVEPEATKSSVVPEPSQPMVAQAPSAPEPPKPPIVQAPSAPEPPKPPIVQTPSAPEPPKPLIAQAAPPPVSQVLQSMMDEEDDFESSVGETTVLGMSSQPMIFPALIRVKTNEKVVINKMEFMIGKDPSRVDYCIFDNSAVSRVHAKILCRNGEFFVVDNHSTNHVYVNGMMIDANVEVRLSHGSRVRLGDEDFEFRFQ